MENEIIENIGGIGGTIIDEPGAEEYAEALSLVYERQARRYGGDIRESEDLR